MDTEAHRRGYRRREGTKSIIMEKNAQKSAYRGGGDATILKHPLRRKRLHLQFYWGKEKTCGKKKILGN